MQRRALAFTLVELLIVVVILGILAAVVIPSFASSSESARYSSLATSFRSIGRAATLYGQEWYDYPPDCTPGQEPDGMSTYLGSFDWAGETSLGGNWDWDNAQFGFTAGVSVFQPSAGDAQLVEVDTLLDDGNLATGSFRRRTDGYISIVER